jgi:hypothetical protein
MTKVHTISKHASHAEPVQRGITPFVNYNLYLFFFLSYLENLSRNTLNTGLKSESSLLMIQMKRFSKLNVCDLY